MSRDAAALQAALIQHLRDTGSLTRPEVAAAFQAVPRHLFLPGLPLDEVYADEAIPTKLEGGHAISSSSQPAIMAIMLEQLEIRPDQTVLEIGAGTGYNAALLGQLVGPNGRVVAIDLDDDIVAAARQHLAAAGAFNVQVVCADGAEGFAEAAPYDRIILTVGAWDIAPAWREQLRPGGRLVLPLSLGAGPQKCVAFVKTEASEGPWLVSESVRDCGFMRLRGVMSGPERMIGLSAEPGLSLALAGEPPAPAETLAGWLASPGVQQRTGVRVNTADLWGGLSLWLALAALDLCSLITEGEWTERGLPCLIAFAGRRTICSTLGLARASGLAFLRRLPQPKAGEKSDDDAMFELHLSGYGPDGGAEAARALAAHLAKWHDAGRPGTDNLRMSVFASGQHIQPRPGAIVARKPNSQLVIDWPA